jgi:localization factor PodJL
MSAAAAPWSVKGIDPKAREIAKDLARRQGLTLGDWLNRMIEDSAGGGEAPATAAPAPVAPPEAPPVSLAPAAPEEPPPIASEELDRLRRTLDGLDARVESAERRSTLAISGIDQSVLGLLSRLESAEREQVQVAARFEGELQHIRDGQAGANERLARAEEAAAQPRSIEALRALETALGKVAAHLYDSETRTRESLTEMRAELDGLTDQVAQVREADVAPSQAVIDQAVARIVQRLEEAEARTSGAVRGLETTVQDLEQRLKTAESRGELPEARLEQLAQELSRNFEAAREELAEKIGQAAESRGELPEARLEQLTQELSQKFETAREELAEKIDQAAGVRLEAMERSLREVSGVVAAAEQRSTRAIDRMGHEVLRVAETLGRRMEGVESRSAQAIEQVGGDVARLAEAMEGRLRRTDQAQADSLERLGTEIARITERLSERVAAAERRSAEAIDNVGEQVSRVTDKLNLRSERASSDLAERIRQSEERTARLLEEAREKIDQRLAATEKRLTEQTASVAPPPPAPVGGRQNLGMLFADPDLPPGPFDDPAEPSMFARRGGAPAGFVPPIESLPPEPEHSPFEAGDFDAASMFRSFETEASAPDHAALDEAEPAFEPAPEAADFAGTLPAEADTFETPAKLSTRELIEQARAAARAASEGEGQRRKPGLFGGGPRREPKKGKLKAGVMVSAAAAALGITAAGLALYSAQRVDNPRPIEPSAQPSPALVAGGALTAPQAAVALVPHLTQPAPTAGPAAAPGPVDLPGLYADAVRRIENHDTAGVADLRKGANLGYGPAQFYLAKLYETGDSAVPKDMTQARLWTQRAADNGEPKAMHNLGLYYFNGEGGPKNLETAAQWFRKAADLGLVDSQYNLARLYEGGFGVAQSRGEAYKWYLIAARSGDAESQDAAKRLKPQLPAATARADEAFAAKFHGSSPSATVRTASR